jgi:histidine ammonia-lyase
MLNADIIPSFTSDSEAGLQLVKTLSGLGQSSCFANGIIVDSSEAFKGIGFEPIELTLDEAKTLAAEKFLFTGSACLLASGALSLAHIVDCIAAVSCESFGALVEPFDATHFEINRQHRGQMASASNLRLLLEGSKRTNSPVSNDLAANLAFQKLPQINGSVVETLTATTK